MAKQEITLKGLDGHEDHLVYDAANGQVGDSLEEVRLRQGSGSKGLKVNGRTPKPLTCL